MVGKPIAKSIGQPYAKQLAAIGASGVISPFRTGAAQWALDGGDSIYGTAIGSTQVLLSQESYGSYRQPRAATMIWLDGSDDYLLRGSELSLNDFTLCAWIEPRTTTGAIFASSSSGNYIRLNGESAIIARFGATNKTISLTSPIYANECCHVAFVRSDTTLNVYKNGILIGTDAVITTAFSFRRVGITSAGAIQYTGKIGGIKVYTSAKDATAVAAIAAERGTCNDTTNLSGYWPCIEESGTTAYDAFGSNDLTLTSGPTWSSATQLNFNPANIVGHTETAGVIIPRDEANPTLDAAGGSLEYSGTAPNPIAINRPCLTFDGTGYVAITGLTGSETVTASSGTSTLSVAAGRVNGTTGTCFGFTLSSGHQFTCEEGSGTVLYNVGTGNDGTLTSFSGAWASKTNQAQSWRVLYGGRLSSGAFVPGQTTGNLCVDGEPKTLAAGKVCADGGLTEINFNPFSKAENNGLKFETAYTTGTRADTRPFNRKFARVSSDGIDRIAMTATEAKGSTRRSAYSYCGITYTLRKVILPTDFDAWSLCDVYEKDTSGTITFLASIEPSDVAPVTDQTIYVATTGDNADDGLTPETANLTIAGALADATGIPLVSVGAGTFTDAVTKSASRVGAGATTIIGAHTISGGVRTATEAMKSTGLLSNSNSVAVLKNTFHESSGSDATTATGTAKTYIFGASATGCQGDVFNYNGTSQGLEVDCVADTNGTIAGHNVSTCHQTSRVVTINPDYSNAPNPIHHVNGAKAVVFGGSVTGGTEGFNVSAGSDAIADETVKIWLVAVDVSGNEDVDIVADTGCTVYVDSRTQYDTTSGAGTVTTFTVEYDD